MKRVLVTGAAGFVGRPCVPALLARGFEVHAASRTPGRAPAGAIAHQADLLDPAQAEALVRRLAPTHLLHLAWTTSPGAYWTSRENFRWADASLALALAFVEAGGRRLVGVGSCAEYAWGPDPLAETASPLGPTTPYGVCKDATRRLVLALADQAGASAAWARLFFLYGPGEHPDRLVPSVARALLAGRPAPCTQGDQIRDFLHVHDAAEAIVALLDGDVAGPVNVASGQGVAVRAVVEAVAREIGRPELVAFGAVPARPDEPPAIVADVGRLATEVGWRPARGLAAGVADAVAYWRSAEPSRG